MPTTSSMLDKQLTPLTPGEEALFKRVRSRLEAYFRDFEELEGFSVLSSNLHRLLCKVALELRCVCYEYHDSFLLIEALRAENDSLREDMGRLELLCDQVIAEAEATKQRFDAMKAVHASKTERLHALYATQESLLRKQWTLESESLRQQEIEALTKEHNAKLKLLQLEHEQQFEAIKTQIESTKNAELEHLEVQLRLQITSQVSRDLGKKLLRQEKLCERHTQEMKQLQRRVVALQETAKSSREASSKR